MELEEPSELYNSFTTLEAWKHARALKLEVYQIIKAFPAEDRNLIIQLKRAARSIAANISEGHGRYTYKDQLNFCVIARGSLSETYNHLIDALDCGYIDRPTLLRLKAQIDENGKILNGYMSYLRSKIQAPNHKASTPNL
jgi:four helix bundle protein